MFRIEKELRGANLARTIRFPESLFETLGRVAQQNQISFNLLVLQCCRYALSHIEQAQPPPSEPTSR